MNSLIMRISNHVLDRYIERVDRMITRDDAKKVIAGIFDEPKLILALISLDPTSCKIVARGIVFCVRGRTVTTCYPCKEKR